MRKVSIADAHKCFARSFLDCWKDPKDHWTLYISLALSPLPNQRWQSNFPTSTSRFPRMDPY